ncbi:MAG TPA: EAL domain-containing protein [Steroidobacteraceae bacterium]|nr:EAL domain-containing protein [Steroidobacteraceae bacterium]
MEPGIRLLMIEDVAEEAELASHQLRRAGIEHVLERVETEAQLREALATFDPSLILSDFSLPRFDGMAALRLATALRPEIPFVFFSGTIGEERAIDALKNGATDYVLKGNARRLASAVTRALGERAERAARLRAERLLRGSEERFRSIVETSVDWIWEIDAKGQHVFCNPSAEAILGFSRGELLWRMRPEHIHPEDQARFAQVFADCVASQSGWRGLVLRWRDADGATRWLESNAVACLDERGVLTGFRGVDRDVTDRRRDEERIRRLSRVHAMLSNTNSTIVRVRDRDELLREACRIAVTHGRYVVAWAGIVDARSGELTCAACTGTGCEFFDEAREALLTRAVRSRQTVVLDRRHGVDAGGQLRRELATHGLSGAAALPLLIGDEVVGVFALAGDAAQLFDEGEVKLLEELAGDLAFAMQSIRQEAHLSYLAKYDSLTHLANRELFLTRLQQFIDAAARGTVIAVVLFDVDRLSLINHTLGRHRGDQVLRQVAERLRAQFPDGVRCGYLGGGLYAVAFPGLANETSAYELHDWFDAHVLAEPFLGPDAEMRVAGHIALALHPADGSNASALLGSAEIAMRNAKQSGERVSFSSPLLNARVARRLSLESRLRQALEREEFTVELQPKVGIASSAVVGFEALLRWNGGADGMAIAPETFVPVLEETGLIEPVGLWVIRHVSALEAQWRALGHTTRIAVNVCARQLGRPDFARHLRDALDARYLDTPGIDLEITESALLDDIDASVRLLEEIRELGPRIAIDDFGTGYSSLNQLVRLPIDTLKIDRSFVATMSEDPNVMAVVATIASLADALGLNTIAEGVETSPQLARLRELGCREYQGFLFSPPLAPTQALKLLL